VAYEAKKKGLAADDDPGLDNLCQSIDLRFVRTEDGVRLFSGKADISDAIRTPEMSMLASAVSARPVVREALLALQRRLGAEKAAVFEGRDMGTVVFPAADVKFFLTANLKTRAARRHRELAEKQSPQKFDDVYTDMKQRDDNDASRPLAPLKPAADAIMIDSTDQSVESVIEEMMAHIQKAV
jgi:cytidylate kinase